MARLTKSEEDFFLFFILTLWLFIFGYFSPSIGFSIAMYGISFLCGICALLCLIDDRD